MTKGQEHILKGIIYEYDNLISVEDSGLVVQGCKLVAIAWNETTDELEFYYKDVETDDEIIPNFIEMDEIFEYVVNNF